MKKSIDNIVINDETCTIYPSTVRRVAELLGWVIQGIFLVCAQVWILPGRFSWGFYAVGYVFTLILIIVEIKNIIYPPQPIVLTYKGVIVPNGNYITWDKVDFISLKPGWRTPPIFHIGTKKVGFWDIGDWYMYTNKKTLIPLFEEYADRKLYIGVQDKDPVTQKNEQKKTPFVKKSPYRNPYGHNRKT
ncbi:MAG: hypothetical protein IKO66_03670 [Paludibacteraceae bacterium]|nr:hypothetical protein [Paludibacteraceae bacterium]